MNCPTPQLSRTRRSLWSTLAALVLVCLLGVSASAQISYSTSFDGCAATSCSGWTIAGGFSPSITSAAGTGYTACNTASAKTNTYSGSPTATLTATTSLGTSTGALATLTYNRKCINYSTGTATPAGSVNFTHEWSTSASGPWTVINTAPNASSTTCLNSGAITFTPTAGQPVFVRISMAIVGSPDCWSVIDDISLSQPAGAACSGTPTPGNTTSTATSTCATIPFTLGLQNVPSGSGITYQWESADDNLFTVNVAQLGTAPTQITSQTSAKWYRCLVTCTEPGGGADYSAPIEVTMEPYTNCYCIPPASTFGCTDGDVIARVILNTLDNNSGTGCPSGTLGYSDYTGTPGLTTTLQAGTSYGCTVYAGQWAEHYSAWIDYNDDGIFGTNERIGYTTTQVPGSGSVGVLGGSATFPIVLACDPPLGPHRLRVRCMYGQTSGLAIDPCTNASAFFETEDYIISILAADPCPAPTQLASSNPTSNSADLSWTLGCAETEWDVHIQAAGGGAPGVPSNPGLTSASYTAGGLTQGQLYEFYVRAVCGPSLTSSWVGPVTFSATPLNDNCADITPVPLAAGATVNASGSTSGATANDGLDVGTPVAAVWHAVTLSECVQSLTVSMCGTTPVLPYYYGPLYTDCSLTQAYANGTTETTSCVDGNLTIVYGTLQAGTYYFPVFKADGFNPSSDYQIAFTAGAACPPAPANDLCANAEPVTCGFTYTGDTQWATNIGAPVFGGACGTTDATANGVWYTVSGVCGSTTASLCGSSFDTKLFVMTGPCGSFACVAGNDDASTGPCAFSLQSEVTWDADASTTYYIYVTGFGTAAGAYSFVVNCSGTPTSASGTVVDDCNGGTFGINVDVTDLGGAATGTITYSVNGGTPVDVTNVGLGITPLTGFVTTDAVSVSLSNGTTGCGTNLGTFYSNCPIEVVCGNTLTINHCYSNNDGRTFTFTSDTPNETITVTFVQGTMEPGDVIRGYSGTDNSGDPIDGNPAQEGNLTGNFPVLNGVTGTTSGGSLFIEIDSDGSGSCQDGNGTPWIFEVECTPGCVDPTGNVTVNTDCGNYNFTIDVEVTFTGDGGYTEVEYTVNGGTPQVYPIQLFDFDIANLGPFNIGDDVFLRLLHPGDNACNHTLGTYTDNGTCPPPGESCALPINIPSVPYTTNGNTSAFVDNYDAVCPFTNPGGKDVVYRYSPPVDQLLSLTLCTGTTNYDTKMYIFQDACTGTPLYCNDDACANPPLFASSFVSSISGVSVTAGNTYYIVVDAYSSFDQGDYTLVIDLLTAPDNDDCVNAEPVTVAADQLSCVATTGDNSAASDDGGAFPCFTGGPYADVWYSFNSGSNTGVSYLLSNWSFASLLVEIREGSCNGTSVYCDIGLNALDGSIPTTPSTDYFVRVASEAGGGGAFDLCVYATPPPYDPCASITPISACDVPTGPVVTAAGDGAFDGNGPFGTPGQEKLFSFTATITGIHNINVTSLTGSWVDFFWKQAGTCDNSGWNFWDDIIGTGIAPGGFGGVALNFTAGNTYYIMWDPEDNGTRTVDFTVICPIPPPPNDDCAGAIAVPCNSTVSGTTVGANGNDNTGIFCGTSSNTSAGVWYTVDGWDGAMTASLCGGTTADTKMHVYTGSCGAFTCVNGNDDACGLQSQVSWTGSAGTTYYIYVYAFSAGNFAFDLTVSCGDNNSSCTANGLALELENDANAGAETTWEIRAQGSNVLAVSGTGLISNADQTMHACLPNGCYYLRVLDTGGDGLTTGGYVLREQSGNMRRIIDNSGNFNTGSVSAIANDEGFCLPISDDRLIYTSCDKLDWRTTPCNAEYVVANDNPAVTAEYGVNNANSGYQMWWFDPNGGYSFRRFQSHNTGNGLPASATRACHFRINSWTGNELQEGVMYNVRVRSRVNGVWGEFGSACRFMVDNTAAACPLTKLMDDPGNNYFACGSTRGIGSTELVHAVPKKRVKPNCSFQNANRYQFRFRIPAENFLLVKTSASGQYFVNTLGLECGKTYDVDVRASFDNGATWCATGGAGLNDPAWGDVCTLTIVCGAVQGGNQNIVMEGSGDLRMYPNPNRGDQLFLSIDALEPEVRTVSVDIFDAFGKRVSARTVAVNSDNAVNTVLELKGSLAAGMYTVTITAGTQVFNERLVIQP